MMRFHKSPLKNTTS